MKKQTKALVILGGVSFSSQLWALASQRTIIVELDPLAPTVAAYEQKTGGGTTMSQWAGRVDFNVQSYISTGPEILIGSFTANGSEDNINSVRREDLWPGERQKIGFSRFRWNVSLWEVPETMRGWSMTLGYEYSRIDSKSNRYTENESGGLPIGTPLDIPDDETDLVTDIRHGFRIAFGQRWVFTNRMTTSLELSFHGVTRRSVDVTSKDTMARADYDATIENLRSFPVTAKAYPEAKLGLGYAF